MAEGNVCHELRAQRVLEGLRVGNTAGHKPAASQGITASHKPAASQGVTVSHKPAAHEGLNQHLSQTPAASEGVVASTVATSASVGVSSCHQTAYWSPQNLPGVGCQQRFQHLWMWPRAQPQNGMAVERKVQQLWVAQEQKTGWSWQRRWQG